MSIFLITSAKFVEAELAAEFGLVPPAFLPVGNERLYSLQLAALKGKAERIILTLPTTFDVPPWDKQALDAAKVEVLAFDASLSLGKSISYAIGEICAPDEPLSILLGDTYFHPFPDTPQNGYSAHPPKSFYNWTRAKQVPDDHDRFVNDYLKHETVENDLALSGLFAFEKAAGLAGALAENKHDFIAALNDYASRTTFSQFGETCEWLDFGHVQTFFQSRWHRSTSRSFNDVKLCRHHVEKTSTDAEKIEREAFWLQNIPNELKVFTPTLLGQMSSEVGSSYRIANENKPSLSELFVFGKLGTSVWQRIFEACDEFLCACRATKTPELIAQDLSNLYARKTRRRLRNFLEGEALSPDKEWRINGSITPSLNQIVHELETALSSAVHPIPAVMHGDFCFSNILYDFRSNSIRVIDPRGSMDDVNPSIFGDQRYDIAKLSHSILGGYDNIIASRYSLQQTGSNSFDFELAFDDQQNRIQETFRTWHSGDLTPLNKDVDAIMIMLFFSMLPLHNDNEKRQRALFANGLRLYQAWALK